MFFERLSNGNRGPIAKCAILHRKSTGFFKDTDLVVRATALDGFQEVTPKIQKLFHFYRAVSRLWRLKVRLKFRSRWLQHFLHLEASTL